MTQDLRFFVPSDSFDHPYRIVFAAVGPVSLRGERERAVVEPVSLRWVGGGRARSAVEPVSRRGKGEVFCRTGESEGGRERAAVEPVSLRGEGRGLL